jgi:serine/threonine-protein kinase
LASCPPELLPTLSRLLDEALELPPPARAQWIDALPVEHADAAPWLRRMLIEQQAPAEDYLAAPQIVACDVDSDLRGSSIGAYRLLSKIGRGGMGEVWLAERCDGEFEQRVAIKQLAWPTPGLLQRFRQERQILAGLEHANIARLIDGGVDAAGAPYLVMEYVEGVPITDYARARALDLRARLELFVQVCEGVQYAHQHLVVHRDLKPSNIFISAGGVPKLLDFGIAKVLATTDEAMATQTAARLLTPDYAAPEQFNGGAITTATDVYALGVVLYELLADVRPRRTQVDGEHAATEPPPPSAALDRSTSDANARRRALRGDLDRIVLTALAHEPSRRYASAEALAADLRRYLNGRPIAARGDSAWYRFRKYAKRHRYALAAAVIVFAVCVAATIVSLHQARVAQEQSRIARDEAQRADAVRKFLVGVLHQADPDENKGQPISAQHLLEKGEQQIAGRFTNQPALEADVAALLGQLHRDLGDTAHGDVLLGRALALSGDSGVPDDVRGRVLVTVAAMEAQTKAKFEASLAHARQALSLLAAEPVRNAEDIATTHWIISRDLANLGDPNGAVTQLQQTLPQDEALLGDSNEAVAEEWVHLGRALGDLERYDENAAALGKALVIMQRIYGEKSNHAALVLNETGNLYFATGDYARAEDAYRKSLNIHLASLDPEHREVLMARNNVLTAIEYSGRYADALPQRLALLEHIDASREADALKKSNQYYNAGIDYRELGRLDESITMLEKALALIEQSQGVRSASSLPARQDLGLALQLRGRYAESDAVFREALAVSLEHGSNTSVRACGLRQRIGQNLRLEHHYAEAIEQLQSLTRDACMQSSTDSDIWRPQVLANLSEAQMDAGDVAAADVTAKAAMVYARKAFPPRHFKLGIILFAQARTRLALGKPAEAEALLREALAVRSPPHPADDPRVLEVKVALVNALAAQGKDSEASALKAEITPLLKASTSPYAADLLGRLAQR